MHLEHLKQEVDVLKADVKDLKGQGADKVLVETVTSLDRRVSVIEAWLNKEVGFQGGE